MMINKRLINLCGESKKYIMLTVLTNWISAICNITIIFLIGKILNDIFQATALEGQFSNKGEISNLTYVFLSIGLLLVVRFTSNLLSSKFSHKSSATVKIKLRDIIYQKLLKLGMTYNKTTSTSSIVQASIEGVEALEVYFGRYLPQFFYSILAPITLFTVMSFISLRTSVVFILCVPLIPLSIIAIMRIAKRILKTYWNSYSNLGETFLDNLQGLTTLKIFNIDDHVHKKMNSEAENFRRITMKVLSMQLNSVTIMDLIAFGGSALGSIVALYQFRAGVINLGQTIIIILLSSEFFIPLRLLGSFFHVAMNGIAASDKIFTLLDIEEEGYKGECITSMEEAAISKLDIDKPQGLSISINNINFSYEQNNNVIKNASMTVPNKSFIAIVGESGSGKSTIASLLLKNYQVNSGEILFNGLNINDIDFNEIYDRVALISTNSYIFNGSILDNLTMANRKVSMEKIDKALELANLKSFVDSLEKGLNTAVGEGGSMLSGGQKQRLALARAILANREVIIFDEATSNIDVESEELIWRSINDLAREKTVIVISHRLANIVKADRIYVIHKGEILEGGTHRELMNNQGQYYKMITEQRQLEGREMEQC